MSLEVEEPLVHGHGVRRGCIDGRFGALLGRCRFIDDLDGVQYAVMTDVAVGDPAEVLKYLFLTCIFFLSILAIEFHISENTPHGVT